MFAKLNRWQRLCVVVAGLALWGSNCAALSLGRITVQSALGEPLRAEVEVPDINAEEAASLKVALALPEAFRAAAMDYSPALASLQLAIQKRSDGRTFIRLSSDRVVNDPFVDLILQATWSSGRVVRDYTMLFDPPNLRQPAQPGASAAPVTTQAAAARATAPLTPPVARTPMGSPVSVEPPKKIAKAPRSTSPASATPAKDLAQVSVKAGDTASKIALANKPARVSLDQMLVALLRANPTAFIDDNINRIKAGALVNIPTPEQAQATTAAEASQLIVAQSKDFNDFRRKFAQGAPKTPVTVADRQVSGTVQAKVEDKKPVTAAPDRLTLSKGALKAQQAEDQLAKQRSAKEAAGRAAELAKNISDLRQLGAASAAVAPAPAASTTPTQPGPTVAAVAGMAAPAGSAALAPAAAPAASVVRQAPTNETSAGTAGAASAPNVPASAAPTAQEPSLLDEVIDNPGLPLTAAGLIALLAGFATYRSMQRRRAAETQSVFLQSHLKPDSFFGASGGQSVDTSNSTAAGSSLVYSPSQLDAVDDVDPVAEADVYLAYGRDLQAEEILKDALRTNPGRIAIHHKFLEIFAKRRDARSFENIASLAFKVTDGEGSDWERICDLGQSIDPDNALYKPGGRPGKAHDLETTSAAPLEGDANHSGDAQSPSAVDLDLDLDFSLSEGNPSTVIEPATSSVAPSPASSVDLDFDLDVQAPASASGSFRQTQDMPVASSEDLAFGLPSGPSPLSAGDDAGTEALPGFSLTHPAPIEDEEAAAPSTAAPSGMLDFDFESLSLDLQTPAELAPSVEPGPTSVQDTQQDPAETKLELAGEFLAIGDRSGARALIEEVIAEASGEIKIKAQHALSQL